MQIHLLTKIFKAHPQIRHKTRVTVLEVLANMVMHEMN